MTEEALRDIPVEYRDRFADLLGEPRLAFEALREDLTTYLETIHQVGLMVKLLDLGVARSLADTALALLDYARRHDDEELRTLVQAAVRYFILEEEDEEITGVLGFDDDRQVINAVCRAVGRTDLVVTGR